MIARELFVKLGFDIDEAEFSRFIKMSDNLKSRLTGLKSYVGSKLSYVKEAIQPKLKESKQVKQIEAIQPIVYDQAALKEVERIKARVQAAKNLRPGVGNVTERMLAQFDDKILQELQNRATDTIKETENSIKTKNLSNSKAKFFPYIKNKAQGIQQKMLANFRGLNSFGQGGKFGNNAGGIKSVDINKLSAFANKIALISTAISGIFAVNARSTLKDVEQFKKTGTTDSGNTFSKDQIKTVDNFNRSLRSFKYSIKDIRNSLVIDLLPPLNEVMIEFKGWIQSNREIIKTKLKDVVDGISQAFSVLLPILKGVFKTLDAVIAPTIGWKNLITAIVGIGFVSWISGVVVRFLGFITAIRGVLGIGARFLAWIFSSVGSIRGLVSILLRFTRIPFVGWISAAIAALVLLADEIIVTLKGGDTFINDFLKADVWGWFNNKLNSIVDTFKSMWSWITKTSSALGDLISNQLDKISNILPDFSGIGEMVGKREINVPVGGKLINMQDRMQKYNPQEAFGNSNSVMNTTNRNNKVLNQRNSFNINVTTPVGTSQEQSRIIVDLVQKELQKTFDYENEKALIAVGVT